MKKFFITGIGTDVGKTVVSAIFVEALNADYWKPVQAGDLDHSDTDKVKALVSNPISRFHKNAYALNTPMSPHGAAELDGITIDTDGIAEPETSNHLVIEGAGGLLVPLNEKRTLIELIQEDYAIIVVSRNYLGSINHTLMTLEVLKAHGLKPAGLIFNGEVVRSSESIIEQLGKVHVVGRINEEEQINAEVVSRYAELFKPSLEKLL